MIAITHFVAADVEAEGDAFLAQARPALEALAKCTGYCCGSIGRCTDDTDAWVLVTEWDNVGSYRRALGTWDVKLHATPLLALARDLPSGFESIVEITAGGETITHRSDRAPEG